MSYPLPRYVRWIRYQQAIHDVGPSDPRAQAALGRYVAAVGGTCTQASHPGPCYTAWRRTSQPGYSNRASRRTR